MFRNSTISGRVRGRVRLSGGSCRSFRCCVAVFRASVFARDDAPIGPSPDAYALYLTWDGFLRVGRGEPGPSPFSPRPAPPPIVDALSPNLRYAYPRPLRVPSSSNRVCSKQIDWRREPTGRLRFGRRARGSHTRRRPFRRLGSRARPSLARPSVCSNPGTQGLLPRAPRSVVPARWSSMELTGTDNLLRVRPNGRQDGFGFKSPASLSTALSTAPSSKRSRGQRGCERDTKSGCQKSPARTRGWLQILKHFFCCG